jgi:sugar phosphate isomerase/epimerase
MMEEPDASPRRDPMGRRDALRRIGLGMTGLAFGLGPWTADAATAREAGMAGRHRRDRSRAGLREGVRFGPLGLQLYSVRDEMERSVEATLEAVAAMGYAEVEFAGRFGHTPRQIRRMVADAGLAAPAAHIPPDFEPDAWSRSLDEAAAAGHRAVIVAWIPEPMRDSSDAWRRTAAAMAGAGARARERGLSFGYHNHAFEFTRFGGGAGEPSMQGEGPTGLEILVRETSPEDVFLELDLFWTVDAGFEPLSTLRRFGERVRMVHLKDRAADGGMVDVGAGALDWPRILGACRDVGVEHFFVEHDRPENGSLRFARASATYLEGVDAG